MKVACFFTGRTTFGGAERRIGRIMNGIASSGIEVEFVFLLYEDIEKIAESFKRAIGGNCFIKFIGYDTGGRIFKHMLTEKYDVAFYIGAYRKMLSYFVGAKVAGSRTVFLQVSTGPSVGQFGSWIEKMGFSLVAKNSTYIDCLYPSTTEYFCKKYKKQIVNTTPCPATDLKRFYPGNKEKRIAFISRWIKEKNIDLFIESVLSIEEILFKEGYKIFLCGKSSDGSVEEKVSQIMQKAKHPEIVVMPGFVNSEEILPKAEIFISLQCINNYPSQSLIEAISCGCYIIASDEGDTKLLVRPEFGARCKLEKGDVSKCILEYIDKNSAEKTQIIKDARSFAEKTFDFQKSIEHYMRIINNI